MQVRLTIFLLFITSISYGQILPGFGFGQTKRAAPVDNTVYSPVNIDNAVTGTGYNQVTYTGAGWTANEGKIGSYLGTYTFNNTTNSEAAVKFIGPKVELWGTKYVTHGQAEIFIDNVSQGLIDFYTAESPNDEISELMYSKSGLTNAEHTIRVQVNGTHTSGSDYWIEIDKFVVYQTDETPDPPTPLDGTWFVDDSGDDDNPGTTGSRFATIGKAASVAQPGDVVVIGNGTYRENPIIPPSGTVGLPITFQAENDGMAIISGLEVIPNTGWTVYSGNIYQKTITLPVTTYNLSITTNTTIAANQIFDDGVMQVQARWPNATSPEEMLDRTKFRRKDATTSWANSGTIVDSGFPNIGWTGGKIFITGWFIAQTRNITGQSGTTLTYQQGNGDRRFDVYYYLTGKLGALDVAKEWHYESNTLYFYQAGGGTPSGVIEYKARNWGFDLRDRSYISIIGVKFKGCEINGNNNTSNIVIDNIRAEHTNHTFLQEGSDVIYYNALQTGFKLSGSNNVVKNSEFKYCASQVLWMGANGIVDNNRFEYISYEGNYGAVMTPYGGNTGGHKFTNNTALNIGRSVVDFGGVTDGQHLNMEIGYNNLYQFGMLSSDGGAVYGARYNNLTGLRVHHNWIHNSLSTHAPGTIHGEPWYDTGINSGIYYDQATGSNTTNDHNVMWANGQCDLLINTAEVPRGTLRGKALIYNNTVVTNAGTTHGYGSYQNDASYYYDHIRNNIFRHNVKIAGNQMPGYPGDIANGLYQSVDPLFVGGSTVHPTSVANPETYFQLQSGSPARNIGVLVPGINDADLGGYDAGAIPFGTTGFIPGYDPVP